MTRARASAAFLSFHKDVFCGVQSELKLSRPTITVNSEVSARGDRLKTVEVGVILSSSYSNSYMLSM